MRNVLDILRHGISNFGADVFTRPGANQSRHVAHGADRVPGLPVPLAAVSDDAIVLAMHMK